MKIVINGCYGGFGISHEGMLEYARIKGIELYPEKDSFGFYSYWIVPKENRPAKIDFRNVTQAERIAYNKAHSECTIYERDIPRDDPALIQLVEVFGETANGNFAELKVVEIPDGTDWQIGEYDGTEWVEETHQTWS